MKLQIIIGSTRQGRISDRIATWVAERAGSLPDAAVEVVDLREFEMPFFDEAISPQFNPKRQLTGAVKKWLDKLAEADGYVLVTPEYNRSYPAVLKNALDQVDFQLARKPVALVAHGTSGGAQAVAHLRGVLPGLLAVTVPKATFIAGRAATLFDEAGQVHEDAKEQIAGVEASLQAMLEDLKWYSDALAAARV